MQQPENICHEWEYPNNKSAYFNYLLRELVQKFMVLKTDNICPEWQNEFPVYYNSTFRELEEMTEIITMKQFFELLFYLFTFGYLNMMNPTSPRFVITYLMNAVLIFTLVFTIVKYVSNQCETSSVEEIKNPKDVNQIEVDEEDDEDFRHFVHYLNI